jgi:hypothetical protein
MAAIDEARRRHERPAAFGDVEITVAPQAALDRDTIARYDDLGVHRALVRFRAYGFDATLDGYLRWVDHVATLATA